MKVLLLTDRMQRGGAETHIAALARGLRARGVAVEVASGGGEVADALAREGIPQHNLPGPGRAPWRLAACQRAVRRIAADGGYDILHAHARLTALTLRGCRRWPGAPAAVVTVHAAFRSLPALARICHWGERTIAVSEDLRADVCDRFGVPAEAVTVIPNGIDCARFAPPQAPAPPHSVLFASRLDEDCASGAGLLLDMAPRLAARFPDLRLTLAGGGNALGRLRALSAGLDCVHLPGHVSDMPELLRQHRIFVGVSRAAMEAAACGCAVLLCGNEGYGGLLTPDNPLPALSNFTCRGLPLPSAAALETDLCRLLEDAALCARAAAAARRWMLRDYDVARMTDRTLALYHLLPPAGRR